MSNSRTDAAKRCPSRRSIPGMGLERITTVLQGVHSNFQTDLFRHLIAASVEFSHAPAGGENAASHRIIADHLRSSSFLIADGVLPSNEGRGYVLRRIMRRAMRHAHLLGAKDPLMHRLVPILVAEMGQAYPELKRAEALIAETLKLEETRFRDTLARGLKLLDEATGNLGSGDRLAGEIAFKLYDTFGFPLDLTEDALRARGIAVDVDGFNAAMAKQREEARRAWAGSGEAATDTLWFALREELGNTEFLGYDTEEAEGTILAILRDGARVNRAGTGETVRILTNQTPFYGESGGQVGDRGTIASPRAKGRVIDTEKKLGALHVHVVEVDEGEFVVGDGVDLQIDGERRRATRANHSATHLLHAAMKRVLGAHVAQKGSLVTPDRLRFDFSHPKPVSPEELERIESMVNAVLRQNGDVSTRLMPTDSGHRGRRRSAVRRKIWRRSPRPDDGRRPRNREALLRRIVRRDACAQARRYRPLHHPVGRRGGGGRAPHRSPDQRRRAALSRRSGRTGAQCSQHPQDEPRPNCRRACSSWRKSAAGWSANLPTHGARSPLPVRPRAQPTTARATLAASTPCCAWSKA